MERIMKAQALGDRTSMAYMTSKKNLEINPSHPIIRDLKEKLKDEESKKIAGDLVNLLFETSLINCGFVLDTPADFTNRIFNIIGLGLGIEPEETGNNEENLDDIPNLEEMPNLEEIPQEEESKPIKQKIDVSGRIVEDTADDEAMEQVD
jgi:molecular chaperone HtpG